MQSEVYCTDQDLPLKSYGLLMLTYAGVFGTLQYLSSRRPAPPPPKPFERALLTLAAYKFSRIVTMSFIGSPLRAPFCTRGESLKAGEVQDVARGTGLQKAIGSLLTCPFCFNVWSTTGFVFAYNFFPRTTLRAAEILSIAAAGDVLHLGYRNMREVSE